MTEESIRAWFNELEIFLAENGFMDVLNDPSRIFNGDESGFSLCPKSGKILAPKAWKNLYHVKLGNEKDNLTVLIVFSANGVTCPPLVLFPYIRPTRAVIDSMPPDWVLGRSETGWMNSEVFFEYVANDFNNWLMEKQIQRPIILFIDGHKSHMTLALSEFCDRSGIILYALPPNTTHMLQPEDVSVFRPLKNEWQKTVREWQSRPENSNKCITKTNFCQVFNEALCNSNMKDYIINGFRKCGLYPLNQDNVDYTKCVKNFQESLQHQDSSDEFDILPEEWIAAKKVVKRIAPTLKEYGINSDIILSEINKCSIKMPQGDQNLIEVGTIIPVQDLEIIPIDSISLELDNSRPLTLISETTPLEVDFDHLNKHPSPRALESRLQDVNNNPSGNQPSSPFESNLQGNGNLSNSQPLLPRVNISFQEEDGNSLNNQPSLSAIESRCQEVDGDILNSQTSLLTISSSLQEVNKGFLDSQPCLSVS